MQQHLAAIGRESAPNISLAEEDAPENGEVFVVYGWLMVV
jgi:hypothetical protein